MQIIKTVGIVVTGCALAAQALPSFPLPAAFAALSQYEGVLNGRVSECPLSGAVLPPSPPGTAVLTRPGSDQKAVRVVLGTGTQNYTCASGATAPVPVGARATLFDASCLAVNFPEFLHALPALVVGLEAPQIDLSVTLLSLFKNSMRLVQGHHFFQDPTTPVFDFQVNGQGILAISKKAENITAPAGSYQGQYGAVDWLHLRTIAGTIGDVKDIYRFSTAGGAAPKTCQGRNGEFQIKYAAEYWFFD